MVSGIEIVMPVDDHDAEIERDNAEFLPKHFANHGQIAKAQNWRGALIIIALLVLFLALIVYVTF